MGDCAQPVINMAPKVKKEWAPKVKKESAGVKICPAFVVTGLEYKDGDLMRELGASWNKNMKGWTLPESSRSKVMEALAKAKLEVSEEQYEAPPAPPAAVPSENANAQLTLEPYKKAVLLKGDTKNIKDQLKEAKGSWNRTCGGWIFPGSRKEEILTLLRADPTNTVEEIEAGAPPAKKAKRDPDNEFIEDDESEC